METVIGQNDDVDKYFNALILATVRKFCAQNVLFPVFIFLLFTTVLRMRAQTHAAKAGYTRVVCSELKAVVPCRNKVI